MTDVKLFICHGNTMFEPLIEDGITLTLERKGSPGQLKFKVLKEGTLNFTEGDSVLLKVNGKDVFYGYVFSKSRDKEHLIEVTAYDQLRYLKNKDTYVFEGKKASEIIQMIATDFHLNVGSITDTEYVIPSRVEDNTTLFDMIQNALDMTLQNKSQMYVLYDDFGKITLKNLSEMYVNTVIDGDTAENFSCTSSIDESTYNQIKLVYDNDKTGTREVYISKSSENIQQWGLLQHFDKLKEGENGQVKADALLKLYNQKTRTLSVTNAFGDINVRAGSLVYVNLNVGDIITSHFFVVEKCKHDFKEGRHLMTLNLRGGEFIA